MKAQTLVERAVVACYEAHAEYIRITDGMPINAVYPKVSWVRGSLKNPNTGWVVDGNLYPGSAEQVIALWDKHTNRWISKLRKYREGLAAAAEAAATAQSFGEQAS